MSGNSCVNTDIGFICEYDYIPVLGDVDSDGKITVVDAILIQV